MDDRDVYLQKIIMQVGRPYRYGAWGPDAYDCSGLVSFCLGLPEKLDAQQLADKFCGNLTDRQQTPPGGLFFYGKSKSQITHVMSVLSHWPNGGIILVGARGGDSTTTTLDAARDQRAFVGVCFGDYWLSNFVMAMDPFVF